jgi:hypothetical protein
VMQFVPLLKIASQGNHEYSAHWMSWTTSGKFVGVKTQCLRRFPKFIRQISEVSDMLLRNSRYTEFPLLNQNSVTEIWSFCHFPLVNVTSFCNHNPWNVFLYCNDRSFTEILRKKCFGENHLTSASF